MLENLASPNFNKHHSDSTLVFIGAHTSICCLRHNAAPDRLAVLETQPQSLALLQVEWPFSLICCFVCLIVEILKLLSAMVVQQLVDCKLLDNRVSRMFDSYRQYFSHT